MKHLPRVHRLACSFSLALMACSGNDSTLPEGAGGAFGMGGAGTMPTGGAMAFGGGAALGGSLGGPDTNQVGGSPSGGGSPSFGGAVATGGNLAQGGNVSTGGSPALGGALGTAGSASKGGASSGGSASKGGSASSGGSASKGGSTSSGGSASKGGSTSSGGSVSLGGSVSAGGMTSKGGATSVGGTTTTGSAAVIRCDNLSMPAGTTGKAKPSGAAGGLKVLDWAGFTGAVSFTFDDANTSQITGYSQLKATGAHMTFFIITGSGNASNAVWKTAIADGSEIGNHTKSHQSAASLSDLQAAQDFIKNTLGATAYTMAAPNGDASWASVAPSLLFLNRGVANGLVSPRDNTNAFSLPAYIPPTGAASSTMDGEVNAAKSGNKWKIFCIHGFDSANGTYQPVPLGNVTTTMSNAVKGGLWAESMVNVGAYWLGQKAIPASATTSATWTLPAHFPPNMCVRITTTGGTVTQKGAVVPWDDHGYYQISLDAGAVTIQ